MLQKIGTLFLSWPQLGVIEIKGFAGTGSTFTACQLCPMLFEQPISFLLFSVWHFTQNIIGVYYCRLPIISGISNSFKCFNKFGDTKPKPPITMGKNFPNTAHLLHQSIYCSNPYIPTISNLFHTSHISWS